MTIQAIRSNLAAYADPYGPYRGAEWEVDISTEDHEDARGFTVQVVTGGVLTFRTVLEGPDGNDQTRTLNDGDTLIGPGGVAVGVIAVRANATIAQINVGYP